MSWLALACLNTIHAIYAVYNAVYAFFLRFGNYPLPLNASRRRIPGHLALLLTCDEEADEELSEEIFTHTLYNAVRWCRLVGIKRLSVYDSRGVVAGLSEANRELLGLSESSTSPYYMDGLVDFPPSPPASDASGSRPLSPEPFDDDINLSVTTLQLPGSLMRLSKRNLPNSEHAKRATGPLTMHLLSPLSSTPAIAAVARSLARRASARSLRRKSSFSLSVKELEAILEGEEGFPAPDLMIVHHGSPAKRSRTPLELHGFPPWQIRLTEIHHDEYAPTDWRWLLPWRSRRTVPFDEAKFRRALDEFAAAEMRMGK